jgi:hypothetical protein
VSEQNNQYQAREPDHTEQDDNGEADAAAEHGLAESGDQIRLVEASKMLNQ